MANPKISILVETIDNTGDVFKDVLASLGFSEEKIAKINEKLPALITGFTLAGAAIGAAVAYTKKAVEETIAYGEEIKNITTLTGQTAEEASRLYQVAQNIGISYKDLSSILENATKKGVDTSIESLLALADEYNSLETPIQKVKFLTDNFGASGLAMGKLFEQGSEQIVAAMGEVNQALVLTDAAIAGLAEYERSVKELEGAWKSLSVTVGLNVIPTLQSLLNVLNDKEGWRAGGFERMFGTIKTDAWAAASAVRSLIAALLEFFSLPSGGRPDYAGGSNTGTSGWGNWYGSSGTQNSEGEHAWGGWESANTPYLVGERGPEIFVPGTGGKIIPNNQLGGGGGSEIDYDRLTRAMVEALERSSLVR